MTQPINFSDYNLSITKNILTAKPKVKGGPAVTVNLNEVVGVDLNTGELKFGKKMFSKYCKDGSIAIEKDSSGKNYLVAECQTQKKDVYNTNKLKLDGALQITIPMSAASDKNQSDDCCSACNIM